MQVLYRFIIINSRYLGGQIGNVVTLPLSGVLCRYGFAGGWPSIFYVLGMNHLFLFLQNHFSGLLAMIWLILWYLCVADTPAVHRRIKRRELLYIERSLADEMQNDSKVVCVLYIVCHEF